jgi:hypothetical protein
VPYQERLPTGVVKIEQEKYGFPLNCQVIWKEEDDDIPNGTVGTVMGFTEKEDRVRVKFPRDFWDIKADELQKVQYQTQYLTPAVEYVTAPAVEYVTAPAVEYFAPGVEYVTAPTVEYVTAANGVEYITAAPGVEYVVDGQPLVTEYVAAPGVEYVSAPTMLDGGVVGQQTFIEPVVYEGAPGLVYETVAPTAFETFVTPTYYGDPMVAPTYTVIA